MVELLPKLTSFLLLSPLLVVVTTKWFDYSFYALDDLTEIVSGTRWTLHGLEQGRGFCCVLLDLCCGRAFFGGEPAGGGRSADDRDKEQLSGMATKRRSWLEVPAGLRQEVESQLGSPVRDFQARPGGFTSGLAGVAVCADGTEVFVKATFVDGPGTADYRREAVISGGLPDRVPAPRLRFASERDGWLLLCFDVAPGRTAQEPWDPVELAAVLDTLSSCVAQLTPSPIVDVGTVADRMMGRCRTWRSLATAGEIDGVTLTDLSDWERDNLRRMAGLEDGWQHRIDGTTLLHFDLRADNCLISAAGSVSFVDWARACTGAGWVDLVCLMLESDLGDIDAEHLFTDHPLGQGADPDAVDGFLVALAGYWTLVGRQPPITHAPGLRQQQTRSGQATLRWLEQRWAI
jgi:hypothetical protein